MPNLRIVFAAVFMGLAWPAWAQTPQIDTSTATVGIPGCQSDVAISARRERISLTSQGKDISALFYEPLGEVRRHAALVIMHDNGIRDDVLALDDHAIQLASRGFAVILPFYLDAERERESRLSPQELELLIEHGAELRWIRQTLLLQKSGSRPVKLSFGALAEVAALPWLRHCSLTEALAGQWGLTSAGSRRMMRKALENVSF